MQRSHHGMSKHLIQTKLSFSSQSDSEASGKQKKDLKRKLTHCRSFCCLKGDSDSESKMQNPPKRSSLHTYAAATSSNLISRRSDSDKRRDQGSHSGSDSYSAQRSQSGGVGCLNQHSQSGSGKLQEHDSKRGTGSSLCKDDSSPSERKSSPHGSRKNSDRSGSPHDMVTPSQRERESSKPSASSSNDTHVKSHGKSMKPAQPSCPSDDRPGSSQAPSSKSYKDDKTSSGSQDLSPEKISVSHKESLQSPSREDSPTQKLSNSPDSSSIPQATSGNDEEDLDVDDDGGIKNIEKNKPKGSGKSQDDWKGRPVDELKRAPDCYKKPLPKLEFSKDHIVLFRIPPGGWRDELPMPFPNEFEDCWNDDHVYMPCSSFNIMPSESQRGSESRWEKIKSVLEGQITGVFELENAILSYNAHYQRRWRFEVLYHYFKGVEQEEEDRFFCETLPAMQKLALMLPDLCTRRIPILKKYRNAKLTFSQQQVACLLANAFFCTFPRRNVRFKGNPLPDINFSNLYTDSRMSRKIEKMKCIINYFERVTKDMPTGTVSYTRQCLDYRDKPDWYQKGVKFTELHVSTSGTIEDDGEGMLQADFANKYVGGGVLGNGLVQEEIRFILCPEMILSRLFTEVLQDDEVLIMTGCERFSDYEGYADTFRFKENYVDKTPRDAWGRRCTEVVAMDALVVRSYKTQFEKGQVVRELNKAYCAFKGNEFRDNLPAVRTGNWGCGAFGGDKQLKALIQMMAASLAGRDVCYFTFGDRQLCEEMAAFHQVLKEEGVSTKNAASMVSDYHRQVLNKHSKHSHHGRKQSLFRFIAMMFQRKLGSSSDDDKQSDSDDSDPPPSHGSYDYKAYTP